MKIGQTAEICWLADHKAITKRLLDLGFEPGARVGCVLTKHGGEISAYWIKGAVIALRREDAELMQRCNERIHRNVDQYLKEEMEECTSF